MDQRDGRIDPNAHLAGSCDADGLRASELQHAVQGTNGDRDFAVILNPLGTSTVERWDPADARWEN